MVRYLFYTIGDLTYQSPLVIFREIIAFYCENFMKHMNLPHYRT